MISMGAIFDTISPLYFTSLSSSFITGRARMLFTYASSSQDDAPADSAQAARSGWSISSSEVALMGAQRRAVDERRWPHDIDARRCHAAAAEAQEASFARFQKPRKS